jgi:hypothetical protein
MKLTKELILALLDQKTNVSFDTKWKNVPCTIAFEHETMVFYHQDIRLQVTQTDIEMGEKIDEPMLIEGYVKMYGTLIKHKMSFETTLFLEDFTQLIQINS